MCAQLAEDERHGDCQVLQRECEPGERHSEGQRCGLVHMPMQMVSSSAMASRMCGQV